MIPVGKIISTHGIKGLVKFFSYSGNRESLQSAQAVFLKKNDGLYRDFQLKSISARSGGFILGFSGIDTIEQVQALVGLELYLRVDQLPAPDNDEYYWRDLIGLQVVTDHGVELGTIVDIFQTGSSDIYVVQGGLKEYLIPAIADVISSISIPGNRMVITPMDGLLDL